MTKVVTVILVITFIACVILYGTNERFSLEIWITNIVAAFDDTPTVQGLLDIWKDTDAPNYDTGACGDFDWGSVAEPIAEGDAASETLSNSFLQRILSACQSFFAGIANIFADFASFLTHLWDSIIYIVDMFISAFDIVEAMVPWNAVVRG